MIDTTPSPGTLYLVPNVLSNSPAGDVMPWPVLQLAVQLDCWVVENARTTRRFLSKLQQSHPQLKLKTPLQNHQFYELSQSKLNEYSQWVKTMTERPCGLMSEAGLPAVADPGSEIVRLAHQQGIRVQVLTGPNSIVLALAASGLNGQSFVFHGYCPTEPTKRLEWMRHSIAQSAHKNQTQICIETPYRNQAWFDAFMTCAPDSTWLAIAQDITGENEHIQLKTVGAWKQLSIKWSKLPTIFLWLVA